MRWLRIAGIAVGVALIGVGSWAIVDATDQGERSGLERVEMSRSALTPVELRALAKKLSRSSAAVSSIESVDAPIQVRLPDAETARLVLAPRSRDSVSTKDLAWGI